jgi:hypothetical protein
VHLEVPDVRTAPQEGSQLIIACCNASNTAHSSEVRKIGPDLALEDQQKSFGSTSRKLSRFLIETNR